MKYLVLLLLPVLASAGMLPENVGPFHLTSSTPAQLNDRGVWDEYGLQQAETAHYESGRKTFSATAYRLVDPTGALGVYEWLRPADATPSKLGKMAVETSDSVLLLHGNYVLSFQGHRPKEAEVVAVVGSLPNVNTSPLPTFIGYLPTQNLIPNSERYIEGPAALAKFDPAIPPSVAAFHMAAEGQFARFRAPGGELKMVLFNYPTPQIAMQRVQGFQKIPGAMAKRSGPLVAVIVSPPNADDAERLLALVRYEAAITLNERMPTRRDNIADLVLNAFLLTGILLVFCVFGGLAVGGLRAVRRRLSKGQDPEAMIVLHLRDR